jgi:hypothetical protein
VSAHHDGCRCAELGDVLADVRDRLAALEAAAQPRLSVQLKDAPAVLGIKSSSFDEHVKHEVPCVRRGSMRIYAIKDLERWLDKNKDLAVDLRRRAA